MNEVSGELWDAIVVGSGLVGGTTAWTLCQRGLKVLLLEAGPLAPPALSGTQEPGSIGNLVWRATASLKGQHIQARTNSFKPQVSHLYVNDRKNPYTTPAKRPFLWFRGRQVGGRGRIWGRLCYRMSDVDFAAASRDGIGHDWPIRYADLEPYYERLEQFLRVEPAYSSDRSGSGVSEQVFSTAEVEFAKRMSEQWPDRKLTQPRISRIDDAQYSLMIDQALTTGLLTIRPSSVVSKVLTDKTTGLATGVEIIDAVTKARLTARGKCVILNASTIETLRILWNSPSPTHDGSLGNGSDLLGRNVMDNCAVLVVGLNKEPPSAAAGKEHPDGQHDPARSHGFYIPRYQNLDGQEASFKRGFGIQGGIGRDTAFWYMFAFGEMLPSPTNRVTLSKRRRDAWGIPAAHIDVSFGDHDRLMIEQMENDVRALANAAGLSIRESPSRGRILGWILKSAMKAVQSRPGVFHPGGAIHEAGGAAMGSSPADSVVNAHNQLWECPNVLVSDGACFTSGGNVSPTLTMMAIAARAAEFAATLVKT
jgi:choline dehydrogenase-like flavoprotein